MGYTHCRGWDYEDHPDAHLVGIRCARVLDLLGRRPSIYDRYGYSTIKGHKYLFRGLAPASCSYIVGNYRGAKFPCLVDYEVRVAGDSRVGVPSVLVPYFMKQFDAEIATAISEFNARSSSGKLNATVLLTQYVSILAKFLVKFLTIHPYVNGNGHSARLMVWILLARFGLWPKEWPLDESPSYGSHITAHRDGNTAPLEQFILRCILGSPTR